MLRISVIMGTIWKRKIILADKKKKAINVAMANSDPDNQASTEFHDATQASKGYFLMAEP